MKTLFIIACLINLSCQAQDEIMELRAGVNLTPYHQSVTAGFRVEVGEDWDKWCGVGRVYWNFHTSGIHFYPAQAGIGYKFKSKYRYRTGIYSNIRLVVYPASVVRYVYQDSDNLVPMAFVEYNLPNYRNMSFEGGVAHEFIGKRTYPVFRVTHSLIPTRILNNTER